MSETLAAYVASQDELVKEAGLALPHQFTQCTYALGPVSARALLSLLHRVHTDHNQIELFPKRNFRCDCPTAAITHACTLHTQNEPPNTANQYGQNFQANVSRDWFHESCCMLRTRPDPRPPTPEPDHDLALTEAAVAPPTSAEAVAAVEGQGETAADVDADDAASDASSSGLPRR
ncbi:hypothetical protein B0H13DRAFT_2670177 [Mycena leptocephala]|nr:hypothetical protein B0H13DRAFT_2670177 [Mycena leptocephala]